MVLVARLPAAYTSPGYRPMHATRQPVSGCMECGLQNFVADLGLAKLPFENRGNPRLLIIMTRRILVLPRFIIRLKHIMQSQIAISSIISLHVMLMSPSSPSNARL